MRIELTLSADYLPNWGVWEGLRELYQNTRDAQVQYGGNMSCRYDATSQCATFENLGTPPLALEALLIGTTSKAKAQGLAGQFGEGLKFGLLALTRASKQVVLKTGTQEWRVALEPSQTFARTVLVVNAREAPVFHGTRVDVHGITPKEWFHARRQLRCFSDNGPEQVVRHPLANVLLADAEKGNVYVHGIFIQHHNDLMCGYDVLASGVKVDRDRNMIDVDELRYTVLPVVFGSNEVNTHAAGSDRVMGMLRDEGYDIRGLRYRLPASPLWARFAAQLRTEYGERVVLAEDTSECGLAAHLGRPAVLSNPVMTQVLSGHIDTVTKVQCSLSRTAEPISDSQLQPVEVKTLRGVEVIIRAALSRLKCDPRFEVHAATFGLPELLGLHVSHTEQDYIFIARSVLESMRTTLGVLVHEVAHALGGTDGTKEHVSNIEKLWEAVVGIVAAGG